VHEANKLVRQHSTQVERAAEAHERMTALVLRGGDVTDLAAAVLELVDGDYAGPLNVAGPDAVSRAELGLLVARREGLDPAGLKTTTGAALGLRRPTEVRLDSTRAVGLLRTRLRGVAELLA
jgi:dTDP-4-dehydrorhamnose reductase